MRTTMNLPDGLVAQVRARAEASGRTVTSLVEEALRLLLEQKTVAVRYEPMPTDGGGGFLIDITDRDAVWDEHDGLR
ncbi:MAG: type II toxin-antitoxin system VapB family antitoxin [Mycobacteriaceae bacterium]